MDDPDAPDPQAPKRVFVHWVVFNIAATTARLEGNVSPGGRPGGGVQGRNDGGSAGWMGPCPPIGRHRYFFKLYALDTVLPESLGGGKATKADLEKAMKGHVLEEAVLMGTYQKRK